MIALVGVPEQVVAADGARQVRLPLASYVPVHCPPMLVAPCRCALSV